MADVIKAEKIWVDRRNKFQVELDKINKLKNPKAAQINKANNLIKRITDLDTKIFEARSKRRNVGTLGRSQQGAIKRAGIKSEVLNPTRQRKLSEKLPTVEPPVRTRPAGEVEVKRATSADDFPRTKKETEAERYARLNKEFGVRLGKKGLAATRADPGSALAIEQAKQKRRVIREGFEKLEEGTEAGRKAAEQYAELRARKYGSQAKRTGDYLDTKTNLDYQFGFQDPNIFSSDMPDTEYRGTLPKKIVTKITEDQARTYGFNPLNIISNVLSGLGSAVGQPFKLSDSSFDLQSVTPTDIHDASDPRWRQEAFEEKDFYGVPTSTLKKGGKVKKKKKKKSYTSKKKYSMSGGGKVASVRKPTRA